MKGASSEISWLLSPGAEPVLVYRWDADGLVAAITFLQAYRGVREEVELRPPKFTLAFRAGDLLRGVEGRPVVFLGLTPTPRQLRELRGVTDKVIVVDNSYVEGWRGSGVAYYNPAARGDLRGEWPSASWVLASLLGEYDPLLIAASVVSRLGSAAKGNGVYARMMRQAGLDPVGDYEVPAEVAARLDSIHASCKYHGLTWYPRLLTEPTVNPAKGALEDVYLAQLQALVDYEVSAAVEAIMSSGPREVCPGVLLAEAGLDVNSSATLTRALLERLRGGPPIVFVKARTGCKVKGVVHAASWRVEARGPLVEVYRRWSEEGIPVEASMTRGFLHVRGEAGGRLGEAVDKALEVLCGGEEAQQDKGGG